jgi:hypothetical protein
MQSLIAPTWYRTAQSLKRQSASVHRNLERNAVALGNLGETFSPNPELVATAHIQEAVEQLGTSIID